MHDSLGREAKSRRATEHSLTKRKQEVEMLRGEIADLKVRVVDRGILAIILFRFCFHCTQ